MKDIIKVLKYLLHFKRYIGLNLLFNVLFAFFSLFSFGMIIPFITMLFDTGSATPALVDFSFDKETLQQWASWQLHSLKEHYGVLKAMVFVSIAYVSFSFLSNISRYFSLYFITPVRNGIVMEIRNDLYHKITILPISFLKKHRKGDMLSRFSSDLFEIEQSVAVGVHNFIKDPISILIYSATLIFCSFKLFLFTIILGPLTFVLVKRIGKSLSKNANRAQNQIGEVMSATEETLTGVKVIKAFNAEENIIRKFEESNGKYTRSLIKTFRRKELGSPLVETISLTTLILIITYGGSLVIENTLSGPVLIFFAVVFSRLIPHTQNLINSFYGLQKGNAAAVRIFKVLDEDEKIIEKPNAVDKSSFDTEIEYRNVSFSYQQEEDETKKDSVDVLKKINFTIKKGESVAIVGPSGSGKTTLVDLFPRFYDCTSGEIVIDGTPIKDLKISSLRELTGIVSQECILFNDTILHNIAFGLRNVREEDVIRAAKIANADEFIQRLPEGYYTSIGDRGLTLSGGQRQRISIARAVLKNPNILILDEATSALDTESEFLVQDALNRLMEGRTSVIIAHRLSTIQHADKIIVLEKGEIVEEGTHTALIEKEGIYKKLVDFQDIS